MRIALSLPLAALALSGCVSAPPPAAPYPFVGSWDCGVGVFRFTNDSHDDGVKTVPIRAVTQNGRSFTLFLADGSRIGLAAVTETGLTWISARNRQQLNCRRL